jgi:mono/diheme cytochrome c family protein
MTIRRTQGRPRGGSYVTGLCHPTLRFIGAAAVLFLTAVVSTVRDGATLQAEQSAAAPAPSETYVNVYNGWKWWHVYCYRCHGTDAVGTTNLGPTLTDPARKLPPAAFLKIVKSGIPDKGMQAWDKLLDDKQIAQIHMYVRARTDKVLPAGRPDEVGPNGGLWVPPAGWTGR